MLETINSILNNALYISILVILLSSLVGFYVKSRARDRCIRDFDGFKVTTEDKKGKVAWGILRAYSSGIELLYTSAHQDAEGHVENSYILYDNELGNLQAIYRFHDDQSEENQRRRKRDIQRVYQPTIFRRAARAVRNVVSTFKDAIVQTMNAILGHRATQSPPSVVLSKRKELTASGAQLLGSAVGNAYEPILEHYIGRCVVLEILCGEAVKEEHGILKEYSAKYIELLNVRIEVPIQMYLKERPFPDGSLVRIERDERVVHVTNKLDRTLLIVAVKCEKSSRPVNVPVGSMQSIDVELSKGEVGKAIELELSVRCLTDLVVPRSVAVVRHAGKREKLSLDALLGLDELPYLPWVKRLIGATKSAGFKEQG